MSTDEIRERKASTEDEIQKYLAERVNQFVADTGCTVDSVDVKLIEVTTSRDDTPRYVVGQCELSVRI